MTDVPWDQRLARLAMRPLAHTPLRPNHLTALGFLAGLGTAALFAAGGRAEADWAAFLFMLAMFLDHSDGELARLTGRTTALGHRLDYLVGSANYTLLFIGLGIGQAAGPYGPWALAVGLGAGLANPAIVTLRMRMDSRFGPAAVAHPRAGGFEIEDFVYLIGPITWLGGAVYFLFAYGLGTLGYFVWTLWCYGREARRARGRP